MNTITELSHEDRHMLTTRPSLFTMYCGTSDGWVPLAHAEVYASLLGEAGTVAMCREDIPHGFIVGHSIRMAQIISEYV